MEANNQIMLVVSSRLKTASEMLYEAVNKGDSQNVNVLENVIRFLHIDFCNANCGIITDSMKNRYLLTHNENIYATQTVQG